MTAGTETAASRGRRGGGATAPLARGGSAALAAVVLLLLGVPRRAAAQGRDTLGAEPDTAALADSLRRLADTLDVEDARRPPPSDTLSLEEALRTALGESPDIRGQRARTSAAGAARWADWGAFLPTASASMNLSRLDRSRNTFVSEEGIPRQRGDPITFISKSSSQSLSFRWDLLRGGRRFAELEAGGAQVEAASRRLDETERRVVAEVKTAYFEALRRRRLVEIAASQLESRRRELEQTRRRYRIAAVNRADLLGARVQVRDAEVRLLTARDGADRARRRLRVVTGVRRGALAGGERFALQPVEAAPDLGERPASRLVERALGTHPELRALRAEVDRASARVWGARAAYLPTISLSFTHTRDQSLGEEGELLTLDPGDRANTFSISASWELFSGFQRKERNAQASADLQQARAELARRRLEIGKTVRDLVDEVRRRGRRLELLREQLELAEERLDLLSEQYRLGSAGFDQLQRAIDEVSRVEREVVNERYDYLSAWARLERWVGDVAPGLPSPATRGTGGGDDER